MIEFFITEFLSLLLTCYIGLNIFGIFLFFFDASRFEELFDSKRIYRESEYNWFGVVLVVAFFHLVFPAVVPLYYFYKLLTYGKD